MKISEPLINISLFVLCTFELNLQKVSRTWRQVSFDLCSLLIAYCLIVWCGDLFFWKSYYLILHRVSFNLAKSRLKFITAVFQYFDHPIDITWQSQWTDLTRDLHNICTMYIAIFFLIRKLTSNFFFLSFFAFWVPSHNSKAFHLNHATMFFCTWTNANVWFDMVHLPSKKPINQLKRNSTVMHVFNVTKNADWWLFMLNTR